MKILFTSKPGDFISDTIVSLTAYKGNIYPICSHCLPIIGEVEGIELGLSADEILVNLVDVSKYKNGDYNYRMYFIPDVIDKRIWIKKLIEECNQKIYGHFELIYFIYQWAKDLVIPDDPNDKNWIDYSYFCSEIVALTLKHGGFSGWIKGLDPNSVVPTEMEKYVKTIPKCSLIESFEVKKV
jgi:hypothetical protein